MKEKKEIENKLKSSSSFHEKEAIKKMIVQFF